MLKHKELALESHCTFFDTIDEMVFMKNSALEYTYANQRLLDFFGKKQEEVYGNTDVKLMGKVAAKKCAISDKMALHEKQTVVQYETINKRTYLTRKFPYLEGIGGIIFDITNQHNATERLKIEKERMEVIVHASEIGLWDWDLEKDVVVWDSHCFTMLGYEPNSFELHYSTWLELLHPDFVMEMQEAVMSQIREGGMFFHEFQIRQSDGSYRWIEGRGKVVTRNNDGTPKRIWGAHIDKTKDKEAREKIDYQHRLLQAFMDNSSAFIAIKDLEGRYKLVNAAWEKIVGLSSDLVIGKTDKEIFPEPAASHHIENHRKVLQDGCVIKEESAMEMADGMHYFDVTIFPNKDVSGKVSGVCVMVVDITERKIANENLENETMRANDFAAQAQIASLAKSNFLANMSHEIRTPMNAIVGLSELLRDTLLEPKQAEYLEKITSSSAMLLSIINDILDFSKIEAGKVEIEKRPVHLKALMAQLHSMFQENATQKGLVFNLNMDDTMPSVILGDALKLTQILTNFLSNAFKFTEQGFVTLALKLLEKNSTLVRLCFSIQDTGIGINESQLGKLFTPFSQADVSTTRKFGGTGLGLSIAKRLGEAMGGKVRVVSQEGVGSTFEFELEVEVLSWEDVLKEISAPKKEPKEELEGLNILLVEDNVINQEVVKAILERVGIHVDVANNGKEGVERFRQEPKRYDAILMDIQMPIMGGYEATRHIRESDKTIPIVALTAAVTAEDKQKALEAGMNNHLSKPLNSKRLYELLGLLCKGESKLFVPIKGSAIVQSHVDTIFEGDEVLFHKLLLSFHQQLEDEFATIVEDVRQNNERAPVNIHTLKGVSGNLGAMALADVCGKIDMCYKKKEPVLEPLIQLLEKTLETLKNELIDVPQGKIVALDEKEIEGALEGFKRRLEEAELIEPSEQAPLVKALEGKVDSVALAQWNHAIDALDYARALKIMKTWEMNEGKIC